MSGDPLEISIIVPCLNEENNIEALVGRIEGVLSDPAQAEILFVDDNSTDRTLEVARKLEKSHPRVRALHKDNPRGLGNAVRFGISNARGRMGVIVMADGVDPLDAIPEFRNRIIGSGDHLVLLSRYNTTEDHDNIPFLYKFYHGGFQWLTRLLVGIKFKDITYAYRAFDLDYVRKLGLKSEGFEISPEITFKTYLSGGHISEIQGRQTTRARGGSKFLFRKAGYGYTRVLLEAIVMRLRRIWK
jgi:dolichol-phosphate mannosyltransferase